MLFFTAGAAVAVSINHNISIITTGNTLLPAYSRFSMTFITVNQLYKKIAVQLSVKEKRE